MKLTASVYVCLQLSESSFLYNAEISLIMDPASWS